MEEIELIIESQHIIRGMSESMKIKFVQALMDDIDEQYTVDEIRKIVNAPIYDDEDNEIDQ